MHGIPTYVICLWTLTALSVSIRCLTAFDYEYPLGGKKYISNCCISFCLFLSFPLISLTLFFLLIFTFSSASDIYSLFPLICTDLHSCVFFPLPPLPENHPSSALLLPPFSPFFFVFSVLDLPLAVICNGHQKNLKAAVQKLLSKTNTTHHSSFIQCSRPGPPSRV